MTRSFDGAFVVRRLASVLLLALCVSAVFGAQAWAGAAAAAETCPNGALRLGPSAALPDCRAYEQVTPVQKGGRSIIAHPQVTQASLGGDSITFQGFGVPGGVGEQNLPTFLARRNAAGWFSQGLLPPQNCAGCADVLGWSEDLTQVYDRDKSEFDEAILLRDSATGELHNLTGFFEATYAYDATSADGSKVFFEGQTFGTPLIAGAPASGVNTYVWDRNTGLVSLVGVLPNGAAPEHGSVGGPYDWKSENLSTGGASVGFGGYELQQMHAFTGDGARAFFTELEGGQLYLRENPASPSAATVQVSASHKTNGSGVSGADPHGPQPAAFMRATPDGSVALFASREELTNDAHTGSEDQGRDLYMFTSATGVLADLTPDATDANGAEVQGVVGMSEDGSYIYFVANGVLATGAAPGTCKGEGNPRNFAEQGKCNLYVWHNGTTAFIAQLSARLSDRSDWNPYPGQNGAAVIAGGARVSPDGQVLLFGSTLSLTGYDNTQAVNGQQRECAEETELTGPQCREFYRFSAESKQLTCVTCDPTGARPTGNAVLAPIEEGTESAVDTVSTVLVRNLSPGGNRFFFSSPDQLVPEDVNSRYNGYEWEADGTGSCRSSSQNGGCLALLTPGDSPSNSYFLDASTSGGDAFVLTDRPLVGQDTDQLADIYDAREGGGLFAQWPATATPCASADECAPSSPPPPLAGPPASATFSGPGNFTPAAPLPPAKGTTTPLTRAQKLARALNACGKKPRRKRARCRRSAHKRYGSSHASKKGTGR
ncbi:MAG TPA: hypothetical protein VGN13_07020 [Solirubrobacteraceae bacterium]|jgi:hypothetical protein